MKVYAHRDVMWRHEGGEVALTRGSVTDLPTKLGRVFLAANQDALCDVSGEEYPYHHSCDRENLYSVQALSGPEGNRMMRPWIRRVR